MEREQMNDNEETGDVHPLDQDYSEPEVRKPKQFQLPDGRLLRAGIIIFVSGLFLLIVTANVLGVFRGVRAVEFGGGYVHQGAMLMILGGGVLILIGYRMKLAGNMSRNSANWLGKWWKVMAFLAANAAAGPLLYAVGEILDHSLPREISRAAFGVFPTAIMVIAVMGCVVHRGWLRGYCIGLSIALLSLSRENEGIETSWSYMMHSFRTYSRGRDGLFSGVPLFEIVLMIQFCGLLGVAYAMLFDKRSSDSRPIHGIDKLKNK
jgi:hypothetical protein